MTTRFREPTTTRGRLLFFLLITAVVYGFIGNAALSLKALSGGVPSRQSEGYRFPGHLWGVLICNVA
jgi:hypothetical protein